MKNNLILTTKHHNFEISHLLFSLLDFEDKPVTFVFSVFVTCDHYGVLDQAQSNSYNSSHLFTIPIN